MLELPLVCLDRIQLLPGTALRLGLTGGAVQCSVEEALARPDRLLAVFARKADDSEETYDLGVQATVEREADSEGDDKAIIRGLGRLRLVERQGLHVEVEPVPPPEGQGEELEALRLELLTAAQRLTLLTGAPLNVGGLSSSPPLNLAYTLAALLNFDLSRCQPLLEARTCEEALRQVLEHVSHDYRVEKLRRKLDREARAELSRDERRGLLQHELRAIHQELGDADDEHAELERLRSRLGSAELDESVRSEAERQLRALGRLTRSAAEYAPTLSHLELILELPWHRLTEDRHDLPRARALLDSDHHGLEDVKARILEHLAVMKLNPEAHAPILCFLGPPGTGKTSLGRSIAGALERSFEHLSLGGMHDESELRGHRRTYVAAMPGRILSAMRRAGARNPVLMLDEIDKLGRPGHEGDPAAALMEILDPRENLAFHDNYLDLPFDLSRVFFLTTANTLEGIPRPLVDRMEVIPFAGYTLQEKVRIARDYLWPRQLQEAGLGALQVELSDPALVGIVERYTREAGVRQLERALAKIARQLALRVAERGEEGPFRVEGPFLHELLGREPYRPELARRHPPAGVAASLGWCESGGDILYVEAILVPGAPELVLTGQLGEVMRESAQIALSLVASRSRRLKFSSRLLRKAVHVHVPAGAVRKDGPSAGAALVVALASALTGRPARPDTAMTGEITLTGLLMPVGAVKAKALAALRAGLTRLLLPRGNEPDLEEVPAEARERLEVVLVDDVDQLLKAALTTDA